MNNEDRTMALLARANPLPDVDTLDLDSDPVTYLATLQQRSSEMTQLDTRQTEEDKSTRNRLIAVAAAVVAILGMAIILLTQTDEEPPVATNPPPTTLVVPTTEVVPTTTPEATELSPQLEEALAVATAFTQGRIDHDMDAIEANAVDGHILGFASGSFDLMDEDFAWQEAVGWTIELHGCEVDNADPSNTSIVCSVTHQNAISESLGEGPFEGTYLMKVMYAGDDLLGTPITETTVVESFFLTFPDTEFTTGTWRPFVTWLETNHPDDASVMLGVEVPVGGNGYLSEGSRNPLLVDESIDLWRQYTAEFVAEQG